MKISHAFIVVALSLSILPVINLTGAVISVDHLVKKDEADNIVHSVVLLGDRHTYYSEYDQEDQTKLSALEHNFQQVVLDFAARRNAVVLIEDPFSSWWHAPRYVLTKLLWANGDTNAATWLKGLLAHCKERKINATSIEARNAAFTAATIAGFHATIVLIILQSMQYDREISKLLYKHYKQVLAWLGFGVATTTAPLLAMWNKGRKLDKKIDQLDCAPQLREYISGIKTRYAHGNESWATKKFGWAVDLEALTYILDNTSKASMHIICAGAYHTNNIVNFLATQGYEVALSENDRDYLQRSWLCNQLGAKARINLDSTFDVKELFQRIENSLS